MTGASNRFKIEILREYEVEVEGELLKFKQEVSRYILERVVGNTRVDTGRLRGNTLVSIGEPDTTDDEHLFDKIGQATILKGLSVINQDTDPFSKVYVQNNIHYSEEVERRGAMYGIAVAEVGVFFK